MNDRAWRVTAVSLLTGFMIGMPGVGQAADGDYDDPALAGLFEGVPAHPDRLFRVEWVASPGRPGRSRLRCHAADGGLELIERRPVRAERAQVLE